MIVTQTTLNSKVYHPYITSLVRRKTEDKSVASSSSVESCLCDENVRVLGI